MRQAVATLPPLARVSDVGQHKMTKTQQTAFKCGAFYVEISATVLNVMHLLPGIRRDISF